MLIRSLGKPFPLGKNRLSANLGRLAGKILADVQRRLTVRSRLADEQLGQVRADMPAA